VVVVELRNPLVDIGNDRKAVTGPRVQREGCRDRSSPKLDEDYLVTAGQPVAISIPIGQYG
jgi:hypothetical protein